MKPLGTLWGVQDGRELPAHPREPPLYRLRIFTSNHVVIKSHFWCFVLQLKKMQSSGGDSGLPASVWEAATACEELWHLPYHYQHNVYHKYRDLTRVGTATQCCGDTGPKHCADEPSSIWTLKAEEIAVGKCRQKAVKFHDSKVKFLLSHLGDASPPRGPIPSSGTGDRLNETPEFKQKKKRQWKLSEVKSGKELSELCLWVT